MILNSELARAWPPQRQTDRDALFSAWWAVRFPDTDPALSPEIFGPPAKDLWRVEELLGDISQGVWAAGWLSQIEVQVWWMLHDPEELRNATGEDHPYCTATELAQWLSELNALTVERGWFPIYDFPGLDDYQVGRIVTLSEASAYVTRAGGHDVVAGEVVRRPLGP